MASHSSGDPLSDRFGRKIEDLRISVTDRCNFRCLYCLPETEEADRFFKERAEKHGQQETLPPRPIVWKPRRDLLSYEEIERLVRLLAPTGVRKIRLTGGEPLLRTDLPDLVRRIRSVEAIRDIALTTNGFLFSRYAQALSDAGLNRVTFSLDSLNQETFRRMTGREGLNALLSSIQLARELGLGPIKINAVVVRGLNDQEVPQLVERAVQEGWILRFIEFMPLDSGRAWMRELVVTGAELRETIGQSHVLERVESQHPSETAERWKVVGTDCELGFISPVSQAFCGSCNRLRLTADGSIRTCLFSHHEHSVKALFRRGASDQEVLEWLRQVVWRKEAGHGIGEREFEPASRPMSAIGG